MWNELQDLAGMEREGNISSKSRHKLRALEDRFIDLLRAQTDEEGITALFEIATSSKSQRVIEAFPLAKNRSRRLQQLGWRVVARTTDEKYLHTLLTRGADPSKGISHIARAAVRTNHAPLQDFLLDWDGDASPALYALFDDEEDLIYKSPVFCATYLPRLVAKYPDAVANIMGRLVRDYVTDLLAVIILAGANPQDLAASAQPSGYKAKLLNLSSAHGRLDLVANIGTLGDVLLQPRLLKDAKAYFGLTAQ